MLTKNGFSLIELLMVLAISAILLMMAVPAYQSQSLKVRRLDGQTMLLEVQGQLERYLFDHRTYPKGLSMVAIYNSNKVSSHDGHYQVSIDPASAKCPLDYCYVLRAEPKVSTSAKQNENEELELHSNGTKLGSW